MSILNGQGSYWVPLSVETRGIPRGILDPVQAIQQLSVYGIPAEMLGQGPALPRREPKMPDGPSSWWIVPIPPYLGAKGHENRSVSVGKELNPYSQICCVSETTA